MTDKLRQGDRVRHDDGRAGVLDGIFAGAVAYVRWDNDRPAYESIQKLSKVARAAKHDIATKRERPPSKEEAEE